MKIDEFEIPLKHLAELMWAGDCTTYESNRRGVNFYSCASHGGWVVDGRHLTSEEREKVDKYITPRYFHVAVQKRPYKETDYDEPGDKETIIGTSTVEFDDQRRSKHISYNKQDGPAEWKKLPVYIFEEDSDWVVLEHETSIRLNSSSAYANPERRQQMIDDAWERYTKHR